MRLEVKGHLADIQKAVHLLRDFTQGKSFTDYKKDALLQSGVERRQGNYSSFRPRSI